MPFSVDVTNTFCTLLWSGVIFSMKNTRWFAADSRNWPGASSEISSRCWKRALIILLCWFDHGQPTNAKNAISRTIGVANTPIGLMRRVRLTPDASHTTISESRYHRVSTNRIDTNSVTTSITAR